MTIAALPAAQRRSSTSQTARPEQERDVLTTSAEFSSAAASTPAARGPQPGKKRVADAPDDNTGSAVRSSELS